MAETYFELLRRPEWQRKRLEVMQANEFMCETCGDGESTLNVHHKRYLKGRKPWEYDLGNFALLCEDCHKSEGRLKKMAERVWDSAPIDSHWSLLGMMYGWASYWFDWVKDSDIAAESDRFAPLGALVAVCSALNDAEIAALVDAGHDGIQEMLKSWQASKAK